MADAEKKPEADRERLQIKPVPAMRQMTVIAQDPTITAGGRDGPILMATISVPAEDLMPGPTGYRVQVIDYDSSTQSLNGIHELPARYEDEPRGWREGAAGIVDDYRFHAQNVYALVMKTLARFEFAMGRRIGWKFKTHQLKVAPHGMVDANAFYTPADEGLVFGYFTGLKGGKVYTCLSHDVVVHETTHALIDALRERYLDPSSPDQAAFHEGLSDVIALLSAFSQPELIQRLLSPAKSKRRSVALIDRKHVTVKSLKVSALFGLADQMGEEIKGIRGDPLRRSTELQPDPKLLKTAQFLEPHRRGEVLVAAVMNGFITAWARRIENSGIPGQLRYPVDRVAEEGADIADKLATMWIRALDYMPPVHLEFADALSAAITADLEVRPDDSRYHLRQAMLESFRSFGVEPAARNRDGIWDAAPKGLRYDRVRFDSMRTDKDEVFRFLWDNFDQLELRRGAYTEVLSVRPCMRIGIDGFLLHETVAEYYQVARLTPEEFKKLKIELPAGYLTELRRQKKRARKQTLPGQEDDEIDTTTPLYGGGTLIFDEYGKLKYHVHNDVFGSERQSQRLKYLWEAGLLEIGRDEARLQTTRLSTIHRLRAIDARRFPAEGW